MDSLYALKDISTFLRLDSKEPFFVRRPLMDRKLFKLYLVDILADPLCEFTLIAASQCFPSPELIESVADTLTAMSSYPDLHERLALEGGALSFLAPLCVEGVGIERQEASLGALALLCSCSGSIECSVNTALHCMFDFAMATPAANSAVMNACVALAAIDAEASIAVATSVIMEHIGELWRSDPSSAASVAGAAICETASNMVPSACDALVQAGFSAAAASAASRVSDPG